MAEKKSGNGGEYADVRVKKKAIIFLVVRFIRL